MTNSEPLTIVVLEDEATDAELIERALRADGLVFQALRAQDRATFIASLDAAPPDLILADYNLPGLTGLEALALARTRCQDVPVIIVTGTLNDGEASELLRAGAADYILKDRLARLPSAVRTALEHARKQRVQHEIEERYRLTFAKALDGIALIDGEHGLIVECNAALERLTGRSADDLRRVPVWEFLPPEQRDLARERFFAYPADDVGDAKGAEVRRPDGVDVPVDVRASVVTINRRRYLLVTLRDISDRRKAEAALAEQLDELRRFQRVTVDRELRLEELEREVARLRTLVPAPPASPP